MSASLPLRLTLRRTLALGIIALLPVGAVTLLSPDANASPSCAAFNHRLYDQLHATTSAQALSVSAEAAVTLQARGFTAARAQTMSAAAAGGKSMQAVHRLYNAKTKDLFYTLSAAEVARTVKLYGFVDQGVVFFAATSSASCTVPVRSYYLRHRKLHRYTSSAAEGAQLEKGGWVKEKVRFHLGKPTSSTFSIAVIPDTQPEVWRSSDGRFTNRTNWLVANRDALGIRFVTHTGDVVDWDTPGHEQYHHARASLGKLNGRIPYSVTIGNHDTAAVAVGGSAVDPPNTYKLIRVTSSANTYLNQGAAAMSGQFEAGKIDNAYHTFSAGGRYWMVLNLEMLPRRTALAWANQVVKAHPRHNVIVSTHFFMNQGGGLSDRPEYGQTSPKGIYDGLLKLHPNIKIVVSGHTGQAAYKEFPGAKGGKIQSFLTTMHDKVTNPTRILEINTATGTVKSFMYAPATRKTYPGYVVRARVAGFVR